MSVQLVDAWYALAKDFHKFYIQLIWPRWFAKVERLEEEEITRDMVDKSGLVIFPNRDERDKIKGRSKAKRERDWIKL